MHKLHCAPLRASASLRIHCTLPAPQPPVCTHQHAGCLVLPLASCHPGCSLAHWEQAVGTQAEAGERGALLAVLDREQQMCEVGLRGLLSQLANGFVEM